MYFGYFIQIFIVSILRVFYRLFRINAEKSAI